MKIFLVRHGITIWNMEHRYQGQSDTALSEEGTKQARKAAEYLNGQNLQAIYSSDLSRCLQTAQIISERIKLDFIVEPRFREISFGVWEGLTIEEAREKYPDLVHDWYHNTLNFQVPEGESFTQVMERSGKALDEIIRKNLASSAVVTHGGVIRAVLFRLGLIEESKFWSDLAVPGSITMLDMENKSFQVVET
ncbi:MAG: histidine phosphatase family protein [Syntrophomonadaceae bacterium]|jgi:alpha-ribazole phosphatase|nr:histidine phosphatase family protein [Syntrophomonadaceae bacterium]